MKNIRIFLSKNYPLLIVKFSICLNRHVFIMEKCLMGTDWYCFALEYPQHNFVFVEKLEKKKNFLVEKQKNSLILSYENWGPFI